MPMLQDSQKLQMVGDKTCYSPGYYVLSSPDRYALIVQIPSSNFQQSGS